MEPLVLITNDDGIQAPGISALAKAASERWETVVVAPHRNRSGAAHGISLLDALRCRTLQPGWIECDGTPTDCVYLAVHALLDRPPSVVLSGVNSGPNLSFDVHYSGTFAGACEGTLLGIPSLAVSLTDPEGGSFECAAAFAVTLAETILQSGLPNNTTLNVNVPGGAPSRYQMTFLGHRLFRHSVHRREDPRGEQYYWIGGLPAVPKDVPGSDCNAVASGLISVTPVALDLTHAFALENGLKALAIDGHERVESVPPPDDMPLELLEE